MIESDVELTFYMRISQLGQSWDPIKIYAFFINKTIRKMKFSVVIERRKVSELEITSSYQSDSCGYQCGINHLRWRFLSSSHYVAFCIFLLFQSIEMSNVNGSNVLYLVESVNTSKEYVSIIPMSHYGNTKSSGSEAFVSLVESIYKDEIFKDSSFRSSSLISNLQNTSVPQVVESSSPNVPISTKPTTSYPSFSPTVYDNTTFSPSIDPTAAPTTLLPTVNPTLVETSVVIQSFSQTYSGTNLALMDESQESGYQVVIAFSTQNYGPSGGEPNVTTKCVMVHQELSFSRRMSLRSLQSDESYQGTLNYLEVDFEMNWSSNRTDIKTQGYVPAFTKYMNSDEGRNATKANLIGLGIRVTNVENVRLQLPVPEAPPTISTRPSHAPSRSTKSLSPTVAFITEKQHSKIIVRVAAGFGSLFGIFLIVVATIVFNQRNKPSSAGQVKSPRSNSKDDPATNSQDVNQVVTSQSNQNEEISAYTDYLNEMHKTQSNASDVFRNTIVTGTNTSLGFTGTNTSFGVARSMSSISHDEMLKECFNRASFLNGNDLIGIKDSGNPIEIEATFLYATNDWLKRKDKVQIETRRIFLQEIINKMVSLVRYDVISPDDASRSIHCCAALLGLDLEEEIPETAVIVSGMRKTVTTEDLINAFQEFGEIENAAVSPNKRGFGLVRYKSHKTAKIVMEKFRKEEIVVQDVAVTVRVLTSKMNFFEPFHTFQEGTNVPAMYHTLSKIGKPSISNHNGSNRRRLHSADENYSRSKFE